MNKEENTLYFEFLILKGLKRIGKINDERYLKRAKHEFDRMVTKGYINYFLMVHDYVKWAKENNIMVGPGRGSCSASLVSYCLNITEVDPLEFGLLFTRFLSPIRSDNPDVDLDFMDIKKDEIYLHLCDKYGINHCAKVATYARFHPNGIMRDVGRIFDIQMNEIEKFNSMTIVRSGGDARANFSLADTIAEFQDAKAFADRHPQAVKVAIALEGHIRHKGIHAAAVVVTEREISTYAPIAKIGKEIAVEWEKQLCEDIGLTKFDILGLSNLTVINDCTISANIILPRTYDDKKVFGCINKGDTVGIFQLNTVGMSKLAQSINIETFNHLYDCTTIFRPGPLHSGQAQLYINRKIGKEEAKPMHPVLKDITEKTQHVMLYQEQVMQIMYKVGGMSWATAEQSRKVMTKSKGKDAFNKMRAEFIAGANRIHGVPNEEAEKIFDIVSMFGSYGFNLSHALTYSVISYWCAWLKTYHPKHFYKSLLKYEKEDKVKQDIAQEMHNNNIDLEYPDINKSHFSYELVDDKIFAGLNTINGIAEKIAQKILKARPFISFDDFKKRVKLSEKLIKGLIVADAFRNFNINKKQSYYNNIIIKDDFTDIEWAKLIYEHTSLKPKINIFKTYNFGNYAFKDINTLNESIGGTHQFLRGVITDVLNKDKLIRPDFDKHIHKFQRHMIYLNLNDGTGNIACQVNPATYDKYQNEIQFCEAQPVVVYGTLSKDGRKMYLDMIQIIDGNYKSDSIDKLFLKLDDLKTGEAYIVSAQPAVSKKGSSYYRVSIISELKNIVEGMLFKPQERLFPGMKIKYKITQPPFFNSITIIK